MCDSSHIEASKLMMKEEDAIMSLKEVYLFNNLDRDERNNFLYSTPDAIAIIQSGEKIDNEKDCRPAQTSIMTPHLNGLFLSLIHISEPTRPVVIAYAVFCLKKDFFNDTATTEIYTMTVVGSVRCV